MKTRILYLLGIFMMVNTVNASTSSVNQNNNWDYDSYNPISFDERGIKFFIFQDGTMDFDIHANDFGNTTEILYKSSNSKSKNSRHRRGTKVVRDYKGRVIRVGRVFVNYNYYGKISRVGSVFISYRRNKMQRVGGLRLRYDRYGNVQYIGNVKYHRYNTGYYSNYYSDYEYDYVYDFNDTFFNEDFYTNYEQFNEDANYYYYKSKRKNLHRNNARGKSKQQMIKRKKNNTQHRAPKKVKRRGHKL